MTATLPNGARYTILPPGEAFGSHLDWHWIDPRSKTARASKQVPSVDTSIYERPRNKKQARHAKAAEHP